jgi:hypothetical protein
MSRNLKEYSSELASKLMSNTLTHGDLSSYLKYTDTTLNEIYSFTNVVEFKNATSPFLVMLSNPDFTNNNYLWQTICARAYFISSYFIQVNIVDSYNVPKPERLIDYIELLKVRLMILLNGRPHFPELIFKVPSNPNTEYWSPLSDSGTEDKQGFRDLVLSDAGLISKHASSPLFMPFHQDALAFANSVINDNANILRNSSIDEKISKGLILHKLFFNYLKRMIDSDNNIDFHTDDD